MAEDLRTLYTGAFSRLTAQVYLITDDLDLAARSVTAAFVKALVTFRRIGHLDDPERWLRTEAVRRYHRQSPRWRRHPHGDPPIRSPFLDSLRELPDPQRRIVGLATLMELPLVESADLLQQSYSRAEHHLRAGHSQLGEVPYQDVRNARLQIEDAVVVPPYEQIADAARPRRRKRILAVSAVVLLLAAAGAAVPFVNQDHRLGPGTPITQVKFVDRNIGYAVVQPCLNSRCALRLAVTEDGGKHWRQRIVPSAAGTFRNVVLSTCCGNAISLDFTRDRKQVHVVSNDGARTWEVGTSQEDPLHDEQPTRTLPSGWIPITGLSRHGGLSALDTVHRVARPMTEPPPLDRATVVAPFEAGGRIWAFGAGKDENRLAWSDDDGASWSTRDGPRMARSDRITTLFPAGDGGVYVQAQSGPTSKPDLWWQGPRPGTWTQLPHFRADEPAINGVLPDGELWISDSNLRSWRTEHHGQSLRPVTTPEAGGKSIRLAFAGVADGMIYATPIVTSSRQDLVFTSTDAITWDTHLVDPPGTGTATEP